MGYKLALLTSLHLQKTGVEDWIEEILPHIHCKLGAEYQIDIFVDNFAPTAEETLRPHRILNIDDYESTCDSYDLAIYQMGNDSSHLNIYQLALKHPGIVILHDYAIHHVVAMFFLDVLKDEAAYFDEVGFNHGEEAENLARERAEKGEPGLWETDAFRYPMTRRLLESSLGVVAFSQLVKNNLDAYGGYIPVLRISFAKEHLEIESAAEDLTSFIKEAVRFKAIKDNRMYQRLRDKIVDTYQELGWPDNTLLERAADNLAKVFGGA